ncbi:MAG TPA: DUF2071 domain-containing protein [Thermoanaerobaculia bacterium]
MAPHDSMDRVSPTLEPGQPVLMHQNWHHLLFLHWEVPPAELQALVPSRLTVDTFEGKAYVGLIPFTVTGARPVLAPPIPPVSNFHEINVRTYVHLNGRDPGVWFFSLDASSSVAVAAARAAYHLSYFHAQMELAASSDPLPRIIFRSHRDDSRGAMPAHAHIRYAPAEGLTTRAGVGTIEHFLIERYILYAENSEHSLYRARVHHQPYPIQRAEVQELDETMVWAAGIKRSDAVPMRHYAREVNVKVYPPQKC